MPITGNAQPFNRQQPKKPGKNTFAHVANTKYGMGDNYGSGIKAKVGKIRPGNMGIDYIPETSLNKPPKNLA